MDITSEVSQLIGEKEGLRLEYKAVLPPSRNIAQLISAFANAEGGFIILGVFEDSEGKLEINGLSKDFRANSIVHKALDLLNPKPQVEYQYVLYKAERVYAIKVEKSDNPILLEGKAYLRIGNFVELLNPDDNLLKEEGYLRIQEINAQLEICKKLSTYSKNELINHYQGILRIVNGLVSLLNFENTNSPTINQEGKILTRLIFSSFVDSFEIYLSDLLYEIFLAKPEALRSETQMVTLKEVLTCSDMQEFIEYWAKKRLGKLQRGSVKAFINENDQIKQLRAINSDEISEIEKIFQIRHLFTHKNGIVDEKFIQNSSRDFSLGSEYQISVDEICDKLLYLTEMANKIDSAAITKYKLAVI